MIDPREVPDFYGYGYDLSVNLDTGECEGLDAESRAADWLAWCWLIVLWPWCIKELVLCWFGLEYPWLGQMECHLKDKERQP